MIGRAVRCSSGRPAPSRPGRSGRLSPWAARSFPVLIGAGAVGHWSRLHLIHPHGAPGTGPAGTVPPGQFCRLPEGFYSPPNGSEKQV